jgi:hypothetical protein
LLAREGAEVTVNGRTETRVRAAVEPLGRGLHRPARRASRRGRLVNNLGIFASPAEVAAMIVYVVRAIV